MSGKPTQSNPSNRIERLGSIVGQLACPVCLGTFAMETTQLVCTQCGRTYPVIDGIPVLIPNR